MRPRIGKVVLEEPGVRKAVGVGYGLGCAGSSVSPHGDIIGRTPQVLHAVYDQRIRGVGLERIRRNVRQIGLAEIDVLVSSRCARRLPGHRVRGVERCSRKAARHIADVDIEREGVAHRHTRVRHENGADQVDVVRAGGAGGEENPPRANAVVVRTLHRAAAVERHGRRHVNHAGTRGGTHEYDGQGQ